MENDSRLGLYTKKSDEIRTTWVGSTRRLSCLLYPRHCIIWTYSLILPSSFITAQMYNTYNRQDTIKLCNIFSSSCGLDKDNGFLYLLSFPSLIESQAKVKQYKGFFVSYKKHLSKHIVQGHAGAINNPLRPASCRLVQVYSISASRSAQPGMPNKYWNNQDYNYWGILVFF